MSKEPEMKKPEIIIWTYHNKDYVSYYLRFENEKGQVAQPLTPEQVKQLKSMK